MSKEAIEDYAEAIQNYFGQKRGASLIASPNDFLKIEEWFKKGIPLRAVQKGIGRHFEKIDPSRGLRAVVVRFAEGAIIDEWEIMKAGGAGPTGKASPEDEAAERKERLATFVHKLRKLRGTCEFWICRLVDELLKEYDGAATFDEEVIEEKISTFLKANATPDRTRSARLAAERKLARYKVNMSEKDYRNSLEENMHATLRVELGIPNIMEEV